MDGLGLLAGQSRSGDLVNGSTVEPGVSHAAPTGLVVSIKHGCSWLRKQAGCEGRAWLSPRHDSRVGAS